MPNSRRLMELRLDARRELRSSTKAWPPAWYRGTTIAINQAFGGGPKSASSYSRAGGWGGVGEIKGPPVYRLIWRLMADGRWKFWSVRIAFSGGDDLMDKKGRWTDGVQNHTQNSLELIRILWLILKIKSSSNLSKLLKQNSKPYLRLQSRSSNWRDFPICMGSRYWQIFPRPNPFEASTFCT